MIEVLLASTVMVVAVLGTMGSITSSAVLGESTREVTEAYLSAQAVLEELQSTPVNEVFARYNDEPRDDANGEGTAPGSGFAVARLKARSGDADGMPGRIVMPVETGRPGVLRETHVDPDLGMPRDLNGDGVIDGDLRQADYRLLPVRVRVEWTGASGDRFVEIDTILGAR